jgi:N-acetylglucosaminyldiphosphoundecaprenol N-acetyl-beta-D-mannosaminyltransferase
MNQETKVAGLKVNFLSKQEVLRLIKARLQTNQKTWLTTVYSEFLYAGLNNPAVMQMLNKANIAIPDGIGIFWAKNYLSIPLTVKSYWGKVFQSLFQAKHSLLKLLLNKKGIQTIPGSELIWDISKMAQENNWSIFLLGGYGDTPKIASKKISLKFPNLKINFCNKNPADLSVIEEINKAKPDILLVAYGPIRQEKWISENLENLSTVKLAVGLGGTFDYIAGKKISPPKFVRTLGLEWLWRFFTQPYRIKRIFQATFGLINLLILYKIYSYMEYRKNVVSVILNSHNQILICQRNPIPASGHALGENILDKYKNYWQFPQGGVDQNESLEKTALREAWEEVGLNKLNLIKISLSQNKYWFTLSWQRIFKRKYRWKGQSQNLVYLRHQGLDNEVKVDNNEFVNYKWVDQKDLLTLVHFERKPLAKIVEADLKEMLEKGKLT